MREVRLNPYILLGSSIRYLLDVGEGTLVKQTTQRAEMALIKHVNRVEILLEELGLNVSSEAFRSEMYNVLRTLEKLAENAALTQEQANKIRECMRTVSDVVKYEARSLKAYSLVEKRLPTSKLLSNVGGLFAENVFQLLPDIAQYDFTQAGKCIAFEVPTAAAFHVLRGAEDVLRSYYVALVAPITTFMTWGQLVSGLRNATIADPPPRELLENLNNIRESFRNPTQHPQKVYDIDEAQDLFNLCIDAVNRMAKDLIRRNMWTVPELLF